mgnify:FL=1
MNLAKNKKMIFVILVFYLIISMLSIYSVKQSNYSYLTKQFMWYMVGFIIIFLSRKIKFKELIKYSLLFYVIGNVLLIFLLLFGTEINGSKCWFVIPKLGSFQPSEFVKINIILLNAQILCSFKNGKVKTFKDNLKIFSLIFLLTLIPAVLTFLEPDTGVVIIYFFISMVMLYTYGIKKNIFFILTLLFFILLSCFLYLYFKYENTFISIFGTSFFYRMDRLLDWSNNNGMQLSNAMIAIKSAGLFGFGIKNTPIYIPEAHTDFIFSVVASNTGLVGAMILIILILLFDINLFMMARKTNDKKYKLIIIGFLSMIIFQQVQNIGMNIGLLPITGITLPFISYGGSSLLSYMIAIAIILNYDSSTKQAHNL